MIQHLLTLLLLACLSGCGLLEQAVDSDASDVEQNTDASPTSGPEEDQGSLPPSTGSEPEADIEASQEDGSSPPTNSTTPPEGTAGPESAVPCNSSVDCADGERCDQGLCVVPSCSEDADCPSWQNCELDTCVPDPMVCSGFASGQLQSLGGACCYTAETHPTNPNCVWYDEAYEETEGACLDAQCESGVCSSGRYCSKACTIYDDSVINETGEIGSDGIVDPLQPDDCQSGFPADGPYGNEFRCVNLRSPTSDPRGLCRAGTTFRDCLHDDQCPEGEVCGLLYVRGETEKRCMTAIKDGAETGEACNSDPNAGPISLCRGPLCYGFGCSASCSDDAHCSAVRCEDGTCATNPDLTCETDADCGAMYCRSLTPYSNSEFTDTFCWPRACEVVGDCRDPDWFCRPYWNGAESVEEVALAPACRKKEPEAAGYGEPCGVEGDGTSLPPCAYASGCIDNVCAGPCKTNSDCPDGLVCLRHTEWSIDVDEDDVIDTHLDVDLCVPWPDDNASGPCESDADCGPGSHCQYRVKSMTTDAGLRQSRVEYRCRDNAEDQVGFGDVCGVDGGSCAADLCLSSSNQSSVPSMCSQTCSQALDCPDLFEFDGFTWKSICLSLNVGHNGTPEEEDDLYVPYCWRTSAIASVAPCNAERQCAGAKEYCRALTIAGNPEEPTTVEHLCLDQANGLDAYPTKDVGEPCSSWSECKGRQCLPDGQGGGYCSALCGTDAACLNPEGVGDLRCTEQTLVPRQDTSLAGVTKRCVLAQTCLSCEDDEDCGGDFRCINMGGLGELADYRCGSPCDAATDCEDEAHSCQEHITRTGAPTGLSACMPMSCE